MTVQTGPESFVRNIALESTNLWWQPVKHSKVKTSWTTL